MGKASSKARPWALGFGLLAWSAVTLGLARAYSRAPRAGDQLREVVALDQFHHQRGDAVTLFESVGGGDIGMVQRGQGLGFASESRQALGVMGKRVRQDLDRDVTIELGITRPIDFAHASATEQIGQQEDAETGAGSESQVLWIIRAEWRYRSKRSSVLAKYLPIQQSRQPSRSLR